MHFFRSATPFGRCTVFRCFMCSFTGSASDEERILFRLVVVISWDVQGLAAQSSFRSFFVFRELSVCRKLS